MYLRNFETASARKRRDEDHRGVGQITRQRMDDTVRLRFARKLIPKETKEWKGPVHYFAHHDILYPEKKESTPVRIVFNSSASQCRDTIPRKPCCYLRYDIAKMYHMIAIPEDDLHGGILKLTVSRTLKSKLFLHLEIARR